MLLDLGWNICNNPFCLSLVVQLEQDEWGVTSGGSSDK